MEKIVRQSMLYDFYGELLNEHQRSVYEDVVVNDLSYTEIARLNGLSRQGVFDMIKRLDKVLEDYESKLHLLEKFDMMKSEINDARNLAQDIRDISEEEKINSLVDKLDGKLSELLKEC